MDKFTVVMLIFLAVIIYITWNTFSGELFQIYCDVKYLMFWIHDLLHV